MSYPRNASSPPHFLVGYVYQISDGAVQTSGVSARVKTGTGSWGAAAGTLDCDTTSGAWTYTPTQGETNAEAFSVSLYKANCSGVGMTVITSKSPTAGYAGLDWGQLINASTSVNLAGTTVMKVNDAVTLPSSASINITGNITGNLSGSVGSVTGAVGSVTGNVGGSVASVTGAVGSVTGNVGGNVTGSVGSVVAGVTVTTNNDKTGYSLTQAFPANFSSLAITVGGAVTAGTVSDKTGYSLSSSQTFSTTGSVGSVTGAVGSVTSGVTVTTNNDKTGYSLTQAFPANFSSLAITAGGAVTVGTNNDKTGYSLTQAFPTNFSSLGINSSGHISRVVLVDTTTTNTDMRGTDGAALASVWTSTIAGRIDMPLSDIPTAGENADAVWDEVMSGHTTAGTYGGRLPRSDSSNVNVKLTGSAHIASDIHELQPAVIEAQHFALGAVDANALAADASSEIATAVRTELATELARIDVTVGSRLATASYTSPPTATTIADAVLGRSVSNIEATAAEHSICTLVLAALESSVIGTSWTIKRTDGTTTHATKTVTTDASAEPITGVA
jgi:hypothetical protein